MDRGVRPMGAWSMLMTLSMPSEPSSALWSPGGTLERYTLCMRALCRISFTRVDLPDPETPVTATKQPSGNSTSMSWRLFSRAPLSSSRSPSAGRRTCGTRISFPPERYCPVRERSSARRPSRSPEWTTSPPCSPAPGPMSTTWSAARMVSSSCSTTITVLPRSRSRSRVSMRRLLSRWWRPTDGSSSTYSTPTRPLPICEARRIRWASPPARVAAERDRLR